MASYEANCNRTKRSPNLLYLISAFEPESQCVQRLCKRLMGINRSKVKEFFYNSRWYTCKDFKCGENMWSERWSYSPKSTDAWSDGSDGCKPILWKYPPYFPCARLRLQRTSRTLHKPTTRITFGNLGTHINPVLHLHKALWREIQMYRKWHISRTFDVTVDNEHTFPLSRAHVASAEDLTRSFSRSLSRRNSLLRIKPAHNNYAKIIETSKPEARHKPTLARNTELLRFFTDTNIATTKILNRTLKYTTYRSTL